MLLLASCWLLGACSLWWVTELPSAWWLAILPVLFVAAYHYPKYGWPIVWIALSAAWSLMQAYKTLSWEFPTDKEKQALNAVVAIDALPEWRGKDVRIEGRLESLAGIAIPTSSSPRIQLTWYRATQAMHAGERWQVSVKLKRPHGQINPGGFDQERHWFVHDIRALGYVSSEAAPVRLAEASWTSLPRLRERIRDAMHRHLGNNDFSGIVLALTIGDSSAMSDTLWRQLRHTGTTHLMAISGLHITLLAALVRVCFFYIWSRIPKLCLWQPAPRVANMVGGLVALLYGLLSGFAVPTQRSVVMVLCLAWMFCLNRHLRWRDVWALALWLVLLVEPKAVLTPGFWLSFVSVALLGYALTSHDSKPVGWKLWLKTQWIMLWGLLPWLIVWFHEVSWIAPLANLFAVPWISFVTTPLGLLGMLVLSWSDTLASILLYLSERSVAVLWLLLDPISTMPLAVLPKLHAVAYVCLGLLSMVMLRWHGLRGCLLIVMLLVPIIHAGYTKPNTPLSLQLLDVGQGLAAVIRTPHHTLLYDTGWRAPNGYNSGAAVITPYLHYEGLIRLDSVLISHSDNRSLGRSG